MISCRLLLLLVCISANAFAGQPASQPIDVEFSLSKKEMLVDLGIFRDIESRRCIVALKNDASDNCTISRIVSNCDCTVVDFKKQTLRAGDTVKIPLTVFKPFIKHETKLETQVAFETSVGVKILTVTGLIYPALRIDRFEIEAERLLSGGLNGFQPIVIESSIPSELSNIAIECDERRLQYKIEYLNQKKTAAKIHFSITNNALREESAFEDNIIVRFKHMGLPVKIPIAAKLIGEARVTFDPARINAGVLSNDEPIKGIVKISSKYLGEDFVVSGAKSPSKDVVVKIDQEDKGRYVLTYEFTPKIEDASVSAVRIPIQCATNDPIAHEAYITLVGAIIKPLACCGNQTKQQVDNNKLK